MLGYNLVELYEYYTESQTTQDYLIMMQLVYMLATITGPVALYAISLIAVVAFEFLVTSTKEIRYVLLRV